MGKEKLVAVAGKGGTGKTTFTALMLRYLVENFKDKDILAVDADPNANLNEAMGVEVKETISMALDDIKDFRKVPQGMTKDMFMEMRVNQALVETEQIDLLVMGNPHGPGCYCYPNDLLKKFLEKLRVNYDVVAVDNEAGLEHLSRRIIDDLDVLIITSDATARGVRSAGRVYEIVRTLGIKVNKVYLLISRAGEDTARVLAGEIEKTGLELLGAIPQDDLVVEFDLQGRPLFQLPADAPAMQAVSGIMRRLDI
ncbi:MAG: AAA family ATPase [Bacillota bacterium]